MIDPKPTMEEIERAAEDVKVDGECQRIIEELVVMKGSNRAHATSYMIYAKVLQNRRNHVTT